LTAKNVLKILIDLVERRQEGELRELLARRHNRRQQVVVSSVVWRL